jgi:transketolase
MILTVEDHYREGGIGEAVAGALSESAIRVFRMAVGERPRSGAAQELLALYGINAEAIVDRVRSLLPQET